MDRYRWTYLDNEVTVSRCEEKCPTSANQPDDKFIRIAARRDIVDIANVGIKNNIHRLAGQMWKYLVYIDLFQ